MATPTEIPSLELGRLTITMFATEHGEQLVNVDVDTDEVPYITAHGMLAVARELLPYEYGYDELEDDDD